uniref:Uncharacterized protein n=1 Tax=Brassica campestris TaxID=3711 RepID=A0A3P5ZVE6_BRACM|nr:unnamed protein product [Brassica rapa]
MSHQRRYGMVMLKESMILELLVHFGLWVVCVFLKEKSL